MANENNDNQLWKEKSEEIFQEWGKYWSSVEIGKTAGMLNVTQGASIDWSNGLREAENASNGDQPKQRWIFGMRHGERVDLTFGPWVDHCFDENGTYVRKDLNLPLKLGERVDGKESYARDTPLTRVGRLQAYLVGEGLRLAGVPLKHVYASAALRSVETAHALLEGLQCDPSVCIKVEPGLFEHKMWHMSNGSMVPFMTPSELLKAGYKVDPNYKPYFTLDTTKSETMNDFYKRNEKVMQSVVKATEADGGNVMFVGHAVTMDQMVLALSRLRDNRSDEVQYALSPQLLRVPYCALAAMRDRPLRLAAPPCPPSINSSSGRYDWRMLNNVTHH